MSKRFPSVPIDLIPMRFALNVPNFGALSDPWTLVDLAVDAERCGWDGFFLWDHILLWDSNPIADPWIVLAAIAARTERITIGPMVTPIARRRPWKVAREATSLDHLCRGRLILGAGLGNPADAEFEAFGEDPDPHVRASKLDEGLEIATGMWRGELYEFRGEYNRLEPFVFLPRPVQQPRIPVWIAGKWPNRAPFRRAALWDGVFPMKVGDSQMTPDEVGEVLSYLYSYRDPDKPFEVSIFLEGMLNREGLQPGLIERFARAGVTWLHDGPGFDDATDAGVNAFRHHILEGPPTVS